MDRKRRREVADVRQRNSSDPVKWEGLLASISNHRNVRRKSTGANTPDTRGWYKWRVPGKPLREWFKYESYVLTWINKREPRVEEDARQAPMARFESLKSRSAPWCLQVAGGARLQSLTERSRVSCELELHLYCREALATRSLILGLYWRSKEVLRR